MPDNNVQFAVVRENPMVEAELVRLTNTSNVLLIASGSACADVNCNEVRHRLLRCRSDEKS